MAEKYDVFISYKAEEFAEASWVRSVLEENGLTCWMAPASIPGGSSYADEIDDAIGNCRVFVLILSQKAQESKWVKKELDMALNKEKVILPFMIENFQLQKAFNYYLTDVQRYTAYLSKANAMNDMIDRINGVLNNGSAKTARPPEQTDSLLSQPVKAKKHYLRMVAFFAPYILGLLLPVYLLIFQVEFSLWLRIAYFIWILIGAFWILDKIETDPKIAALCFGSLSETELNEQPSVVFSKIASVFGKDAFISNECPEGFVSYYKLRLIEFGSWDGQRVNYLKIAFRRGLERYDPSVLYLHTLSKGNQSIKMLTKQGFILTQPPACISPATDFLQKGDLHVCLYHRKKRLHGAIIYNCPTEQIQEHFQGEWKDEE